MELGPRPSSPNDAQGMNAGFDPWRCVLCIVKEKSRLEDWTKWVQQLFGSGSGSSGRWGIDGEPQEGGA